MKREWHKRSALPEDGDLPSLDQLVLVDTALGMGLRYRCSDDNGNLCWFDENNNLDDSGYPPVYWWELPRY